MFTDVVTTATDPIVLVRLLDGEVAGRVPGGTSVTLTIC
jgi:hypothetical protein